jgi:hypothetical protein
MLTADLLANLLISRFFLTVLGKLGGAGTFALFLGLAVISFVFIFAMAPETNGRPLEAIRVYWENGRSGRQSARPWPSSSAASRRSEAYKDDLAAFQSDVSGRPAGCMRSSCR